MASRSQTGLACARVVGMTKSSMPRPWVKGCAFGDTPANSSKGLLGFQASQHPRSMWKMELALLLTRVELRITRQSPLPQLQELIDVWNR